MLFFVRIEGESLWPELVPGKHYLATSLLKAHVGDYLVFKNPGNSSERFVKKIVRIAENGYEVAGTVPWAHSSKEFGLVQQSLVLGKIIFKKFNW